MSYKAGTVLFAGGNIPEHIEEAKKYIERMGLTRDDVKMLGSAEEILIVAKRQVTLEEKDVKQFV